MMRNLLTECAVKRLNLSVPGMLAMLALSSLAAGCNRDEGHASRSTRDATQSSDTARADASAPNDASPPKGAYAGAERSALPKGVMLLGGSVIPEKNGAPSGLVFTHVRTPKGDMIWLETARSSGSKDIRFVKAELSIPPIARDEHLFMASCDVRGVLDGHIVAIVVDEPGVSRYSKVRQAWRVDPVTNRFEVVPVAGVSCEDPDRGPE